MNLSDAGTVLGALEARGDEKALETFLHGDVLQALRHEAKSLEVVPSDPRLVFEPTERKHGLRASKSAYVLRRGKNTKTKAN